MWRAAWAREPQPIHSLEQFGTSFADDEPSVELDPVLATERQGPYARSNRLTATFSTTKDQAEPSR